MFTAILFSFLTVTSNTWAQQYPAFSKNDPLGGLVYSKYNGKNHYLGYFCLERQTPGDKKAQCVYSQFGIGNDLLLGVDPMGNEDSSNVGTWMSVGPVFNKQTSEAFYTESMNGPDQNAFRVIWQNIWARENYNWSQNPNEVSRSAMKDFLALFAPKTEAKEKEEVPQEESSEETVNPRAFIRKLKRGGSSAWIFGDGYKDQKLYVSTQTVYNSRGHYVSFFGSKKFITFSIYNRHHNWNALWNSRFEEEKGTLVYDKKTKSFKGQNQSGIYLFKIKRKNGLTYIEVTVPNANKTYEAIRE